MNLISDLVDLLLSFRANKYVMLSDIKQAFLQIKLKRISDKDKFCFFWYKNGKLVTYRYNTIVFGFSTSPFILNQIIKQHVKSFPNDLASQIMHNNFYVDNLIYSHNNPEKLAELFHILNHRMEQGGFQLRSWNSNHKKLQQLFDCNNKLVEHGLPTEKVLGYTYNTVTDSLSLNEFKLSNSPPTKRIILSNLSKVFDPLSLFAPVTVKAKIIMQTIWKQGLKWDEPVPDQIAQQWEVISNNIIDLQQLSFPRQCYDAEANNSTLAVFCDTSQSAYAFAAYIRTDDSCQLLFAKVKVAPTPASALATRHERWKTEVSRPQPTQRRFP
jgi:hypothetical protein